MWYILRDTHPPKLVAGGGGRKKWGGRLKRCHPSATDRQACLDLGLNEPPVKSLL